MRILFTGGGTGGHFYPIISIADELNTLVKEKRLLPPELYFVSPRPYNPGLLFERGITYKKNSAGKLRRYFSVLNFLDLFRTGWGIIVSLVIVYRLYPDVVFGKGGYASFPVLFAARILRIPVVIHESDTVPGRVSLWAGKFAERIAVSYKEAAGKFRSERVAYTGQPVRKDIAIPITEGAKEFLKLEEDIPTILILGGSQGAQKINEAVFAGLERLVGKYQVVHQTGGKNIEEANATAEAILANSPHKNRYKAFGYLNPLAMRMAAGTAQVVVSRAGSTIFEIAAWGIPAIIIPINERISRDQRSNAFAYARSGAAVVVEEANLSANILVSETDRILSSPEVNQKMRESAKAFYKPDAGRLVAEEILKIALSHEVEK